MFVFINDDLIACPNVQLTIYSLLCYDWNAYGFNNLRYCGCSFCFEFFGLAVCHLLNFFNA